MLNNVSLIGRLTKDVTMLSVGENVKAQFTLAVNRDYKDKDGNTPCDFLECEAWNASASFLEEYTGKGDLISVSGSLRLSVFEDKNGNTRYKTYVQADRVNLLAKRINQNNEELTAKPKKPAYKRK